MPKLSERNEKAAPEYEDHMKREAQFAVRHKNDTDEKLLQYLVDKAAELGRIPTKRDIPGYTYIKSRLGAWPRVLEKAGLRERRPKKLRRRPEKKT
jgi:hypothetical protein